MLDRITAFAEDFRGYSTGGNPQIVDTVTFASLQASFDTNVLSGAMSDQNWYSMVVSRYPQYTEFADVIVDEYRQGTRGEYTSSGMTRPQQPSTSPTSSPTPTSLLQSSDAAFIAAAVAALGIALLIMRGR